jgi:hypothetical protein
MDKTNNKWTKTGTTKPRAEYMAKQLIAWTNLRKDKGKKNLGEIN